MSGDTSASGSRTGPASSSAVAAHGPETARGLFVEPTLFDDVNPASRSPGGIFGPVLVAMPFRDYDDPC